MSIKIVKPWGYFLEYNRTDNCVLKKLVIYPGQSISKQYHNLRNEFWYVQFGDFEFDDGINIYSSSAPQTFSIKAQQIHKVTNIGKQDLIIYEMQYGDVCSEEDIVRVEDQYNRIQICL